MHTPKAWFHGWAHAAQLTAFQRSKGQDKHQQPSIFSKEKNRKKKAVSANKPWQKWRNSSSLHPSTHHSPLQEKTTQPIPHHSLPVWYWTGEVEQKGDNFSSEATQGKNHGWLRDGEKWKDVVFMQWEGRNESEIECRLQRGVEHRPAQCRGPPTKFKI